ncbi:MAG: hypothetical protein AB1633_09705, partial [Elusimicrobiota bacterium]
DNEYNHLVERWGEVRSSSNDVGKENLFKASHSNMGINLRYSGKEKKLPVIAGFSYDLKTDKTKDADTSLCNYLGSAFTSFDSAYGPSFNSQTPYFRRYAFSNILNDTFYIDSSFERDSRNNHTIRLGLAYADFKSIIAGIQFERAFILNSYSYYSRPDFSTEGYDQKIKLGSEYLIDSAFAIRLGLVFRAYEPSNEDPEVLINKDPGEFLDRDVMYLESFNSTLITFGLGMLYDLIELDFAIGYEMLKSGSDFRFYDKNNGLSQGSLGKNRFYIEIFASKHF